MNKKQSVNKDILIFSILTTITVTVWIALDVYWAMQKSETPQIIKKQLEPLNPKLDTSALENLGKKDFFALSEEGVITTPFPEEGVIAAPFPEEGVIATPPAELEELNQSTSAANP